MNITNSSVLIDSYFANKSKKLTSLLLIIVGSLLLTVSAKVSVPFYPVPMTMQTLVVLFIGLTFGRFLGPLTIFTYLAQGALGLPVFANGGGFLYLMGPTGGYLLGFFLSSIILSHIANLGWNRSYFLTFISLLIGLFVIFFIGLTQLGFLLGKSLTETISLGLLPFIYGELFKISILAIFVPLISRK